MLSNPDDKGEVTIPADIEGGEVKVRIDGAYLTEALRACGGIVDLKFTDGKSPVLFVVEGYQLVVMPMLTADSKPKAAAEAKPEDKTYTAEPEPEVTEPAEAETVVKAEKPKRSRKKEPVAVA